MSDVIGHPVEVRRWDEEDWSRLIVEDNAWFDGDDDPDEFVGLADDWDERIHLTLDVWWPTRGAGTSRRSSPEFLGRFGVTGSAARELTELYRAEVYPTLDDEYTEGGCPRIG